MYFRKKVPKIIPATEKKTSIKMSKFMILFKKFEILLEFTFRDNSETFVRNYAAEAATAD